MAAGKSKNRNAHTLQQPLLPNPTPSIVHPPQEPDDTQPRRGDRSRIPILVLSPLRGWGVVVAARSPGLTSWATLCRPSGTGA